MTKAVVIGKGKVGEATGATLKCPVDYHDPFKGAVVKDFNQYDFAIVCVDTLRRGPQDHQTVFEVLQTLLSEQYKGTVLIRSTVNPEFSHFLSRYSQLNIVMFPEFMRQTDDLKMDTPWAVVLGGKPDDTERTKAFLIESKYCIDQAKYLLCSHVDAMIIKLCQNAGLATKVIFYNMVNELCVDYDADYSKVRLGVGADERVGLHYSVVPSPDDGLKGFKGHCLPKDVESLSTIDRYGFFKKLLSINEQLGR